eukprot:m.33415 g.33415  ORF g.33415 m.33415 type:complete len:87 (+) comp9617_c0_seq2:639-899(+)
MCLKERGVHHQFLGRASSQATGVNCTTKCNPNDVANLKRGAEKTHGWKQKKATETMCLGCSLKGIFEERGMICYSAILTFQFKAIS